MAFFIKAVRAIAVETLGVLLVLWLVFGVAIWTTTPDPRPAAKGPSLGEELAWGQSWNRLSRKASDWLQNDRQPVAEELTGPHFALK